ncbi:SAM-dependent methyltransferase [Demequina sp. B12]|uniref:THUMP-like domain-containing protein n=1 Tax=Demequina sp. B12 TaxID=2992757 RepID=UPI00237A6956|nr:SAM-dependent methyltransferase [Demequina sp. B12]MDE0572483.1 SAM-dependent methyltransferase [Demequina sp. B12]
MDPAIARLLTSPDGWALVEAMPPYVEAEAMALGTSMRAQGVAPELVSGVLTQSRLRADARVKFGDFAAGMLLTQDGLEQATRLEVAARHAARFRDAGVTRVADLTCGIGADAMAMSALGLTVTAVERDEATALIADHNLRHWPEAQVVHADSTEVAAHLEVDGYFVDPARRNARGRRHDPQDYSPSLDWVLGLRDLHPAVGVKVGPAVAHDMIPPEVEAEWVSVDGSVVEASLWCGPLAHTPGHVALVLRDGQAHRIAGDTHRADTGDLGEYVYEPDGAVIRAGLIGAVADRTATHLIDESIAYLTANTAIDSPFMRGYRVVEVLPLKTKAIAAALKARNVGAVDIKKRGVDITPEQLRPQLKLRGTQRATLILTRMPGHRAALIVEPL